MQTLDGEEEALRRAVSRNDFAAAALSAGRYAKLVESALPDLTPKDAEARVRHACSLLDWAWRNLRAARTRIGRKLIQLQGVSQYHAAIPAPPTATHSWKIDA